MNLPGPPSLSQRLSLGTGRPRIRQWPAWTKIQGKLNAKTRSRQSLSAWRRVEASPLPQQGDTTKGTQTVETITIMNPITRMSPITTMKGIRPRPEELVPSRYAMRVGEIDVLVVSDGVVTPPAESMATNADPAVRG